MLVGVVKRYYSTAVNEGIGVTMVTTTMGPVLAVQGEFDENICEFTILYCASNHCV